MQIKRVSLHNIRSYELHTLDVDPHTTLILGQNGTGKTSLLEAVYYLCRGTSFRGSDKDLIRHDKAYGAMKIELEDGTSRRASISLVNKKTTKEFIVNDKKSLRLPVKQRLPVVLFEPDELRVLTSSPSRRRDFLDGVISRLVPQYAATLSRYARTVLQRNELLKQRESMTQSNWESTLFAWDVKFAELATAIVSDRKAFVATSNSHLSRLYSQIAGNEQIVEVSYSTQITQTDYQQQLIYALQSSRQLDSLRGYTSVGPHRDDFTIALSGHLASETASRGELRSIMLAYKLLEVELQQVSTTIAPLILMDDVFSELDTSRETSLMHALEHYQTIITATNLRDELKTSSSVITL